MSWNYIQKRVDEVETEVTQRDQFLNEDLDLSDTLVREAVQNSLDAATGTGVVSVVFRELANADETHRSFFKALLEEHLKHADAAGLDTRNADFQNPKAIVIEDFGTTGLTGPVDRWGDTDFCDFWRRHGKSHKSGMSRGRHGLGKLVFSCSSKLGAFFGSTVRSGTDGPYLMGQCVLNLRNVEGSNYKPHGFYSDILDTGEEKGLQVPIRTSAFVAEFHRQFQLERGSNPGLSIVIPFPVEDLCVEKMIEIGIINYFFPILTGQLKLKFNDVEVTSSTLRNLAEQYAKYGIHDADARFAFIEAVSSKMKSGECIEIKDTQWGSDGKLSESVLDQKDLEALREKFKAGEVVGLKLPIQISHKSKGRLISHFHVFVQRPEGLSRGEDFYVRNGLTVPKERRFGDRKSLGALVANEPEIAGFLGDAENAAHSSWSGVAEKLKKNYRNCENTLRAIRHSLIQFHDLLAQAVEEEDDEALLDVLWVEAKKAGAGVKKKRDKQPPFPDPNIPMPKPRPFRIDRSTGGFALRPTTSTPSRLPVICTISAAYDRLRGDPFSKHSKFDFDFTNPSGLAVNLERAVVQDTGENWIRVEITDADFNVEISGFDPNRDLVVKAEI